MKIGLIVVAVLLLVGMGACSKFVGVRNDLVTQREAINAAWSTVDVALQRRADLIPNLVETVKASPPTKPKSSRTSATPAPRWAAHARRRKRSPPTSSSSGALSPPAGDQRELSATPLQRELPAPAGRAGRHGKPHRRGAPQVQRGVQRYNTSIELFPNNIVAGMSGFTRNDAYFKTEPGARTNPKVQF